jgi:hypothetical protein
VLGLRGGNPSRECKPGLLLAAEMMPQRLVSFFVFAKHEATHEHRAKHDDQAK